jgi:hypothetical protein
MSRIGLLLFAGVLGFSTALRADTPPAPFVWGPAPPIVQETQKRAQKLIEMKKLGTQEKVISGGIEGRDDIYVEGVPARIQPSDPRSLGVIRHFSAAATPAIVESGVLIAGPRPYIDPYDDKRVFYNDLSGPMFTTRDFLPQDLLMGVTCDTDYVDFELHPETGVLFCEAGNYLIPTQLNYPEWQRKEYVKYQQTGKLSPGVESLAPVFKKLDAEGGMQPAARIPIRVIEYKHNGKITRVNKPSGIMTPSICK